MSQCPKCGSMVVILDKRVPGSYGKGEPKFDDCTLHCTQCCHVWWERRMRK